MASILLIQFFLHHKCIIKSKHPAPKYNSGSWSWNFQ